MTNKKRLLAVNGVEERIKEHTKADSSYITNMTAAGREKIRQRYEHAVWIDGNLNNSCMVDPFFNFHFYDDTDAAAFKLRWI